MLEQPVGVQRGRGDLDHHAAAPCRAGAAGGAKSAASAGVATIGAITQGVAPVRRRGSATASSWRVEQAAVPRAMRSPRTPSAGLGSSGAWRRRAACPSRRPGCAGPPSAPRTRRRPRRTPPPAPRRVALGSRPRKASSVRNRPTPSAGGRRVTRAGAVLDVGEDLDGDAVRGAAGADVAGQRPRRHAGLLDPGGRLRGVGFHGDRAMVPSSRTSRRRDVVQARRRRRRTASRAAGR